MLDLRSEVGSLVVLMGLERCTDLLWGDWWLDNCWLGSYSSVLPCERKVPTV
ncbi:hypothetical protein [Candidatus Hodgkinia cicadicola]|uniref:hypothetical protein n=1 Tax=Candidatus Hodgkinia cicadicola TaxID=573658 RepID=UPI001788C39A